MAKHVVKVFEIIYVDHKHPNLLLGANLGILNQFPEIFSQITAIAQAGQGIMIRYIGQLPAFFLKLQVFLGNQLLLIKLPTVSIIAVAADKNGHDAESQGIDIIPVVICFICLKYRQQHHQKDLGRQEDGCGNPRTKMGQYRGGDDNQKVHIDLVGYPLVICCDSGTPPKNYGYKGALHLERMPEFLPADKEPNQQQAEEAGA